MKNIWLNILKPRGFTAKWLLFVVLIGLSWAWANGHFEIARQYLDTPQLTIQLGTFGITVYDALKSLLSIIVIFWVTAIIAEFSEKRIGSIKKMRVANKALFQKISQILIYVTAFIFTLNTLGIDLTSLTVLSGAIGIGLGFGLQKIAANFISGIILILERALKPGDLIELQDGTFGHVRKSSSRATLIETYDGKEVIVPNEEFIIKQVINWTLNSKKARVTITFGVSYNANIEIAKDLALEAAINHPRCLKDPEPQCFLDSFGDSSINFIMYLWVADINDGLSNIKSDVMFDIWRKFKTNNIEIPFPQRDFNLKAQDVIQVRNIT